MTEEQFLNLFKYTAMNTDPWDFYQELYKLYWKTFTRATDMAVKSMAEGFRDLHLSLNTKK